MGISRNRRCHLRALAAAAIAAGLDYDDEEKDSNINVEDLGMTSERQREIQGSLFRMLGHESNGNGNDESAASRHSRDASNGEIPNLDDFSDEEDVVVNMSGP